MIPDVVLFVIGFCLFVSLVQAAWKWFGPEYLREQRQRRRAARRN